MATPRFPRLLSRRGFVKLAGAVAAVAGMATERVRTVWAAPGGTRWVYYLDPDCGSPTNTCVHPSSAGGHDCAGCKFCRVHARSKKWADPGAVWRAHACCRCTLSKKSVSTATFEQMFGKGKTFHREFDARRVVQT